MCACTEGKQPGSSHGTASYSLCDFLKSLALSGLSFPPVKFDSGNQSLSSVHLAQLLGLEVCFREVSLASDTPWCWGGVIVGHGSS